MLSCQPAQLHGYGQIEEISGACINRVGEHCRSSFIEGHQPTIKEGVEVSAKEEAIEDIQSLFIGGALSPRFGVAGAEQFRDGDAGDGAGSPPIVHERFSEEILADALLDEGESLGGTRWVGVDFGDLGGVLLDGLVGQRHRQFGGATQQTAQGGFVGGSEGVVTVVEGGEAAGEFSCRRALREGRTPDHRCLRRRDVGLGLVAGGEHHDPLCFTLTDILPAMGVAGPFDEGAFEGVHDCFGSPSLVAGLAK